MTKQRSNKVRSNRNSTLFTLFLVFIRKSRGKTVSDSDPRWLVISCDQMCRSCSFCCSCRRFCYFRVEAEALLLARKPAIKPQRIFMSLDSGRPLHCFTEIDNFYAIIYRRKDLSAVARTELDSTIKTLIKPSNAVGCAETVISHNIGSLAFHCY